MTYYEVRRIAPKGPVVVTFVDAALCRRTIAVPFARSGDDDVRTIVALAEEHTQLRPPALYEGGSD